MVMDVDSPSQELATVRALVKDLVVEKAPVQVGPETRFVVSLVLQSGAKLFLSPGTHSNQQSAMNSRHSVTATRISSNPRPPSTPREHFAAPTISQYRVVRTAFATPVAAPSDSTSTVPASEDIEALRGELKEHRKLTETLSCSLSKQRERTANLLHQVHEQKAQLSAVLAEEQRRTEDARQSLSKLRDKSAGLQADLQRRQSIVSQKQAAASAASTPSQVVAQVAAMKKELEGALATKAKQVGGAQTSTEQRLRDLRMSHQEQQVSTLEALNTAVTERTAAVTDASAKNLKILAEHVAQLRAAKAQPPVVSEPTVAAVVPRVPVRTLSSASQRALVAVSTLSEHDVIHSVLASPQRVTAVTAPSETLSTIADMATVSDVPGTCEQSASAATPQPLSVNQIAPVRPLSSFASRPSSVLGSHLDASEISSSPGDADDTDSEVGTEVIEHAMSSAAGPDSPLLTPDLSEAERVDHEDSLDDVLHADDDVEAFLSGDDGPVAGLDGLDGSDDGLDQSLDSASKQHKAPLKRTLSEELADLDDLAEFADEEDLTL
eukprot:TRINITY_DN225_c0_g2_i1.p1 TRINITY_DN225_c0_g2~~TRINITY_DN225_c0_g2_i1.p1  ORF type:complete len:551 (-),score=97.45 TRINITY_DN225_c0_g2_i1:688-2340(-)